MDSEYTSRPLIDKEIKDSKYEEKKEKIDISKLTNEEVKISKPHKKKKIKASDITYKAALRRILHRE